MNAFETDLQQLLVVARPAIDWVFALRKAGLDGPDVWRQEDPESWPMSGPPEEYALPPLVWWSDELRRLAEKAYRASYDRFLDPGESYEFTWPPHGALWERGSWRYYISGDDLGNDVDTAAPSGSEDVDLAIEPAIWVWHLEVERIRDDSVEAEQPWLMGRTEVDPRTVEYGVFGGNGAHDYVEILQKVVERAANGGSPTTS